MEFEKLKIREKGQITIPQEFREDLQLETGKEIIIIKEKGELIIRPLTEIKSLDRLKEDFMDVKICEKFWKDVKSGKVKLESMTKEEFLEDLKSW